MDQIKIENLEVFAYHGVFPQENENGQTFYVNARLYTDTKAAGNQDDLTLSTHYGEVCHFIQKVMTEHTFQLIETVAEKVAEGILLTYERVDKVVLEIKKPFAPIGLPFESVSVEIKRKWHDSCVAFGSNLGEKDQYIRDAIYGIQKHPLCKEIHVSSILRTTPYGGVEQEEFLNGALTLKTLMDPEELLMFLQFLEQKANRERIVHWGPRTLDLDIIFYDHREYYSSTLQIPHKDMKNRDFVLKPVAELIPYYVHPRLGKTVVELLEELENTGETHIVE